MNKIAAYEIALSTNPLWTKEAAPVREIAGGVGGAVLGGLYAAKKNKSEGEQEPRSKKRNRMLKGIFGGGTVGAGAGYASRGPRQAAEVLFDAATLGV